MNDPVHNQLTETNKTLPLSNKTQLLISMNFKRFASLVMFFIFLALLRFVLEHNTIQTKRVLALFEFCYPTQPGNLTERENLRHVPFLFSLRIFVSAFSARTWLACSEISLSIDEKKLKRGPRKGRTKYNLADGVTTLAQLSMLCTLIEHALQTNYSARYIRTLIQK